jgi:hypothetical protein
MKGEEILADIPQLERASIRLNRNSPALDDGTNGPFTIEAAESGLLNTANFNRMVSSVMVTTITTRALTEISGSNSVPVASPFRCGVGFKQGDVPAGASFSVIDGSGNLLSVQADAVNHWPDGSVRWCEVRGYTAQSISPAGTDTLSLVRSAAAFNNTLPNRKTPAQLLSDLQSFGGAQDLNIELSSMASATGLTNNVYTTGTWAAHFNTLAAGPYLQQVNMGPCCMGFRAWGQLDNGVGQNHAHIHVTFYVWLWLDPSTGAIRDVEYIVWLHNGLYDRSTDGTLYSEYPIDRYNYKPALKNGSTVIVDNSDPTMFLHSGTLNTLGGHHSRAFWLTARADGKPRWISGTTVDAPNLHITLDPIQPNPQTKLTARRYLMATGLLPNWAIDATDAVQAPATLERYYPMIKGAPANNWYEWNTFPGSPDAGGNGPNIGYMPCIYSQDLFLQTAATRQIARITGIGHGGTFAINLLDTNGRIVNPLNVDFPGLTGRKTGIPRGAIRHATPSTEDGSSMDGGTTYGKGGWGGAPDQGSIGFNPSHYINKGGYYNYLIEGGAHNRDIAIVTANMPTILDPSINISPTVNGVTYGGNCAVSCAADERYEAWSFREIVLPPAILPERLADGTAFGEFQYYKYCLANTAAYCNALLPYMPAAMYDNGFWIFTYQDNLPQNIPIYPHGWGAGDGHSAPWMQAYVAKVWGYAKLLYTSDTTPGADGTPLGTNLANVCRMMRKYWEGFINTKPRTLLLSYLVTCKRGNDHTAPWRANWNEVGVTTGQFTTANWTDTSGWIYTGQAGGVSNGWGSWPLEIGAAMIFSTTWTAGYGSIAPPAPFTPETQTYFVVAAEPAKFRIQLGLPNSNGSFDPKAAPIVSTGTVPVRNVLLYMQRTPAGSALSFVEKDATGARFGQTHYAQDNGSHDSYLWFWWEAVRSLRRAGLSDPALGDTALLQSADAILMKIYLAWMGSWNRSNLSDRTFAYVNL